MKNYHNHQAMHFKHITLVVKDYNQALHFYHDTLGFLYHKNENSIDLYADQETLVTLIENKQAIKQEDVYGLYHVAFLLPSKEAFTNTLNRLFEHRYQTSALTDHGVSIAIYLSDPDGNGIEIYIDKDESLWPKENGKVSMYTKGYPLDDIMSHLSKNIKKNIDPNTKIGHLHFYVPSLHEAKAFYVDLLGFEITQLFMNSALFISDHEYHHHLGLNTWLRHSRNRADHETGLKSYTLYMPQKQYDKLSHLLQEKNLDINHLIDPLNQHLNITTKK